MPKPTLSPADAQAKYLQRVAAVAKKKYEAKKARLGMTDLPFDPQGRVLVEVSIEDIYRDRYQLKYGKDKPIPQDKLAKYKLRREAVLGHPIQAVSTVSVDVREDYTTCLSSDLESYRSSLEQSKKDKLPLVQDIVDAYKNIPKGRIISLQQETHFHAQLVGRMLQKAVKKVKDGPEISDKQLQKALDSALLKLNKEVRRCHARALEIAYSEAAKKDPFDTHVFERILNKELDNARAIILPLIAKELRISLIKETKIIFDKKIVQHLTETLSSSTTATSNDYIHLDDGLGMISFVGASDHTAHHQMIGGDHTADRIIYSHHLANGVKVTPLSQRQHIRVPSLPVRLNEITRELLIEDLTKPQETNTEPTPEQVFDRIRTKHAKLTGAEIMLITKEYLAMYKAIPETARNADPPLKSEQVNQLLSEILIEDTASKITALQRKYALGEHSPKRVGVRNAFVYNLYTSLNKDTPLGWYDEDKNQQTQSAAYIFQAAHQYNRDNPDKPLCLVQNVPVNGFGEDLDAYRRNDLIVWEAILMTELTSLHTIYDVLDTENQSRAKKIFDAYQVFLLDPRKPLSFYDYVSLNHPKQYPPSFDSTEQDYPDVLLLLRQIKIKSDKNIQPKPVTNLKGEDYRQQFTTNAKIALAKLFNQDAYSKHQYGFTYQALSVFVEQSSIGGCKSANERTQSVNSRVCILELMSLDPDIRNRLLRTHLKDHPKIIEIQSLCDNLEQAIEKGNPDDLASNLDKLAEALSLEAYAAMLSLLDQGGHSKLGKGSTLNFWNTNKTETIDIASSNASDWQAHKGLMTYVEQEFCGIRPKTRKEQLVDVGIGGASALTGAAAGAVGGGLLGYVVLVAIIASSGGGMASVATAIPALIAGGVLTGALAVAAPWLVGGILGVAALYGIYKGVKHLYPYFKEMVAEKRREQRLGEIIEDNKQIEMAAATSNAGALRAILESSPEQGLPKQVSPSVSPSSPDISADHTAPKDPLTTQEMREALAAGRPDKNTHSTPQFK